MPSRVLQEYSRHRPVQITNPGRPFYFRLRRNIKDNVWNSSQAMGQNTLSKFVKTMCRKAGKNRRKTNHSARKTTATLLVNVVVPPIYPSLRSQKRKRYNFTFMKLITLTKTSTVISPRHKKIDIIFFPKLLRQNELIIRDALI